MKKLFMQPHRCDKGFALLYMVLIMGAVMMILLFSFAAFGLNSLRASRSNDLGARTRAIANGCAEYALNYLRSNKTWTGTNSLMLMSGNCQYTIINTGGNNRQISIVGAYSDFTKRININITSLTPRIVVGAWEETNN